MSRDLQRLVLLHPEGVLELWDTASAQQLNRVELAEQPELVPDVLAVNDDGSRAAVILAGNLHVLDPATGEQVLESALAAVPYGSILFFSRQQDALIVGDCDGILTVVDLDSGLPRLSLRHSGGCIVGADISPDGSLLAASTSGGPLTVWNTQSGEVMMEVQGTPIISRPQFSPDGRTLYASTGDALAPHGGWVVRAIFTRPEELATFARSRLTRDWTEAECQEYLHLTACP